MPYRLNEDRAHTANSTHFIPGSIGIYLPYKCPVCGKQRSKHGTNNRCSKIMQARFKNV